MSETKPPVQIPLNQRIADILDQKITGEIDDNKTEGMINDVYATEGMPEKVTPTFDDWETTAQPAPTKPYLPTFWQKLYDFFVMYESQKRVYTYTEFLRYNIGELIIGRVLLAKIMRYELDTAYQDGFEFGQANPLPNPYENK